MEIKTLYDLCDYLNDCEDFPIKDVEECIESNGWVSDMDSIWFVCHCGYDYIEMCEDGRFEVVELPF